MNIYEQTYRTVPDWWIHNAVADVVEMGMDGMKLDDKRVFARWLRGFHQIHFSINSQAHNWLTCPCEEFKRPVQLYLQRYLQISWPFVVEAVPTLPDSPYEEILRIDRPVASGDGWEQGALL